MIPESYLREHPDEFFVRELHCDACGESWAPRKIQPMTRCKCGEPNHRPDIETYLMFQTGGQQLSWEPRNNNDMVLVTLRDDIESVFPAQKWRQMAALHIMHQNDERITAMRVAERTSANDTSTANAHLATFEEAGWVEVPGPAQRASKRVVITDKGEDVFESFYTFLESADLLDIKTAVEERSD